MNPQMSVLVALALAGCSQEANFQEQLVLEPSNNPLPIDQSITQTDVMLQTVVPDVDIVFMVDNSCSMGDDQDRLVENFPSFMRWFLGSGLDYHIGVISSDVFDPSHSGKLQGGFGRKWISKDDANQIAMFSQMAVLGISGSGDERGTDGIYMGLELERDGFNAGFYREESALHVICVSDEPDNSQLISPGEFVDWFDGLKRTADDRTFSSIESPTGGGRKYGDVTSRIGGVMYNIREANWSSALDILGLRATGMKTEYFLSRTPLDESIVVAVRAPIEDGYYTPLEFPRAEFDEEGNPINAEGNPAVEAHWYYVPNRNSIVFINYVPEEAWEIQITYTVRSSALL